MLKRPYAADVLRTSCHPARADKSRLRTKVRRSDHQFRAFRLPSSAFAEYVENYFIALDSPFALSCLVLFRHGEWKQLVEKDVNPLDFNTVESFRDAFAAISFLRKYPNFDTGIDLKQTALDNFLKYEEVCKQTNRMAKSSSWAKETHDDWLINSTRRKIEKILHAVGEESQGFDIDFVLDKCSWGPGSTLTVKGDDTSASIKFQCDRDLTRNLYSLYGSILEKAFPGWIPSVLNGCRFVTGNSIVTVPKNAKTERTIAIEPGINSVVQSGIGRLIRRRLRSAGYDLNSDKRNQDGARKGSRTGSLATVDFSSASDTIATEVVRNLLPPKWFSALDDARSQYYTLNGVDFSKYEKFSTMGCGFTFELESLIFVSAALATCEFVGISTDEVSVFGDDIIIPSAAYDIYAQFCRTLGFTVNPRKSYSSGVFRESCGSYYFLGQDVKPIFLKKKVLTLPDLVGQINAIRNSAHRRNGNYGCDVKFLKVWSALRQRIGSHFYLGPALAGDLCISSNFDEARPSKARNQLEGYYYSGWVPKAVCVNHDSFGRLLAGISSCGRPGEAPAMGNLVPLRKVVRYATKHRMFAAQWYNYGPWM